MGRISVAREGQVSVKEAVLTGEQEIRTELFLLALRCGSE
jgi:hypothetical protein